MPRLVRLEVRRIAAVLWLSFLLPLPVLGQAGTALRMQVDSRDGSVRVSIENLFADTGIQRSLEAGLPVRLELVTELWRDRWLDSQESRHEWRATVRFEPLEGRYSVETAGGVVAVVGSLDQAASVLGGEIEVPLSPASSGRYYYLARMQVETLSLSDLEELRRWLRGEMAPAIGSDGNVGSALGRGVLRLFVRALDLPAQRVEARTPRFTWEE